MAAQGEVTLSEFERRSGGDRRQRRLQTLFRSLYMRRRREVRRDFGHDYYLDIIERRIAVAAVTVVLLSCADIGFTLTLLRRGAAEVNPFMRYLLEIDTGVFVVGKLVITIAGVLFLVAHGHFRLFRVLRGHHALYAVLCVYLVLFNYQINLLNG